MASFALTSVEKEYKIDISEGKVTVGRGPFLQITDKRVSRNHATLEVSDGSFTILPTHSNPTFYQACGETKFEPLEKDVAKILNNGDCISFLPNDLVFRVERKDNDAFIVKDAAAKKSPCHEATEASDTKDSNVEHSKVLEDNSVKDNKLPDREGTNVEISKQSESVVPDVLAKESKSEVGDDVDEDNDEESGDSDYEEDGVDEDETKFEETAQLLNKTRVLPSWMTKNKGNDGQKNPKKGKTQEKTSTKIVAEVKKDLDESPGRTKESLKENEHETTTKNGHEDKLDDGKENGDKEDVLAETEEQENVFPVVEEENKKRKRDEDDEHSNKREKKLPSCPYGARCYRKNPVHFQEYSHDQASDEDEDKSLDDLPECPYGEYCYRQNPRHRREYKHTPQPKTRERKAKKKAGIGKIRDDDEDGPNDYDFEDSFIDDESESEHEPSDDSDWQPSGGDDDDDDDDVKELLAEARNFTKNKKMLKPT